MCQGASMNKLKFKSIAVVAIAAFLSCVSLAYSGETVTKDNKGKICPKLAISKSALAGGILAVEINVPAEEERLEHLFQAWLIISGKEEEVRLRVPIRVFEIKGNKRIIFDSSPAMLKKATLVLDCHRDHPARSSVDEVTLDLPSLLGFDD